MKTICLTRGRLAQVDPIDFAFLRRFRWCCNSYGYAVHYWTDDHGGRQTTSVRPSGYDLARAVASWSLTCLAIVFSHSRRLVSLS